MLHTGNAYLSIYIGFKMATSSTSIRQGWQGFHTWSTTTPQCPMCRTGVSDGSLIMFQESPSSSNHCLNIPDSGILHDFPHLCRGKFVTASIPQPPWNWDEWEPPEENIWSVHQELKVPIQYKWRYSSGAWCFTPWNYWWKFIIFQVCTSWKARWYVDVSTLFCWAQGLVKKQRGCFKNILYNKRVHSLQ